MTIKERFLNYIKFDTRSSELTGTSPSTIKQFKLAEELVKELHSLGILNAYVDEHCYVYASIDTNCQSQKAVGLIAHLDTATETSGANVKPRIISSYDGNDIIINQELNIVLKADDFPRLKEQIGHELITTDGTTLLGADDKAGIAIIMSLLEKLVTDGSIPHPKILITFTPDEEIGRGTSYFNFDYYRKHNCHFAYTVDGDKPNVINFENFNAATAIVNIKGLTIHPGSAKGKMINSQHIAFEFHEMLPSNLLPSLTEKKEGFNHLTSINGTVEKTTMQYLIRNHDMIQFRDQIKLFDKIANYINHKYQKQLVDVDISDSYYNMQEVVLKNADCLTYLIKAMKRIDIEPTFEAIRGGTDGARLSFHGLICPNIGTGGGNFHGPYEYLDVNEMQMMVKILINLMKVIVE